MGLGESKWFSLAGCRGRKPGGEGDKSGRVAREVWTMDRQQASVRSLNKGRIQAHTHGVYIVPRFPGDPRAH